MPVNETIDPTAAPTLMDPGGPEYLFREEVARLCRVDPETVRLKLDPALRPVRIGGRRMLYSRSRVLAMLNGTLS
jgi:hypothetical protein